MTDGPFKNRALPGRWKRYCDVVINDAASPTERVAQAFHAMLGDVNMTQISSLMSDLDSYSQRSQVDLLPTVSIGAIFANHPNSVFANTYKKHLMANVRDEIPFATARTLALATTVSDLSHIAKNRIDEQSLLARERRDINQQVYNKFIQRNQKTFATLSHSAICDALATGNKHAFRAAIQKKEDVDEGPAG